MALDLATLLTQLEKQLPTAAMNAVKPYLPTLVNMGTDELTAWVALAMGNSDAAMTQILAAMTDQALADETTAAAGQVASDTGTNADKVTAQKEIGKEVWNAILVVAGGLLAMSGL
jgi:hypothetical protein